MAEWKYVGLSKTERHMAILNCVALHFLGGASKAEEVLSRPSAKAEVVTCLADVVVDVSQNPCRRAFSNKDGNAKCLTTSSILYSFGKDRVLVAFEKMLLQGHSLALKIPSQMNNRSLQELAGQGISLPTLGLIMVALR